MGRLFGGSVYFLSSTQWHTVSRVKLIGPFKIYANLIMNHKINKIKQKINKKYWVIVI